jgi:hypothetical protein
MPARFVRKTMVFLTVSDQDTSSLPWEPVPLEVRLYPNPTNDQITLHLKSPVSGPVTVQLYSTDGRLLRQTTYTTVNTLIREDIPTWPRGVYWVKLNTEKSAFAGKFVKE